MNKFSLSGKIFRQPTVNEGGTVTLHFLVRNPHEGKFYEAPMIVTWSSLLDSEMIELKEGDYIEVEGHMQTIGKIKPSGKYVQDTYNFADQVYVVDSLPEWEIPTTGMIVVGMYQTFKRG